MGGATAAFTTGVVDSYNMIVATTTACISSSIEPTRSFLICGVLFRTLLLVAGEAIAVYKLTYSKSRSNRDHR